MKGLKDKMKTAKSNSTSQQGGGGTGNANHIATGTDDGLRQRLQPQATSSGDANDIVASPAANVSTVPPTVNKATICTNPSDIPRRSRGAVRLGSLILIWLLLLLIGALVVRRIYIMAS